MVAHTPWLLSDAPTLGVGFTVTVVVCGAPGQPLATGVTVIVAIAATVAVVFTPLNDGMLPVLPAPSPIDVLLLVQL